jgi:hypothetical protein
MPPRRSLLRDNVFLIAAVALPLLVVAFFLAASAIPRFVVPPPAYDLLLEATDSYYQRNPRVTVDFEVRDGTVEATVRPVPADGYAMRSRLFLFDHTTMGAREIPLPGAVDINAVKEGDPPRTIVIEELAGRRVLSATTAPDGYQLEHRSRGGPGIVGEVFGMRRYNAGVSLVKGARVIPIELPAPFREMYLEPVSALGWLVENGRR